MYSLYANVIAGGVLIGIVYALIALGLTIMFGVMRVVNFAHGELVVLGMYIGYLLWLSLDITPVMAVPLSAIIMFCVGYVLQIGLINRFIRRPHHAQFILFIGLALIITGIHMLVFGPDARSIADPSSFETYEVFGLRLDAVRLYGAAVALVMIALLLLFLRYSTTGSAIRAAADNQTGAQAIGLRVNRLYAVTAGIGVACAGVAGTLISPIFDTQPYLAGELTLLAFIIVIIGGMGSLMGALVGGILIGVSESVAALLINPAMKAMFSYGLMILVLLLRPQGLFGVKQR
ncbi:branched-chain amino acid ABC transporter permease [Pusillimonas sp. DMV24BSW_D]|uniref:branched-chain amino acid ABC transporter permease n=1 Tax=Neopusillimonas aestuarii TaxID=2716226 RepID=UPI000C3B6527|nr:branched-chain amino acid ABC transporter permease [Pusillimonas sp. DMV24BSW_D]MBF24404.1 branched-chain amino acid ABC transporter permease [Pusillimonas sp.]QIM49868.1 branched-chain amino acid ABC transporter permease [Pusillimonas sp. DMV24BSW_D]|tara:strand:- start:96672 stop:97541 length:870 start_codon:yes stop_codon:yes gene_type:complete